MRRRALEKLARLSIDRPITVIVAAALLTLASLPLAYRAASKVETDFAQLIPKDPKVAPVGSLFFKSTQWFGTADKLYVCVELDDPELAVAARPFIDAIAAELAKETCIKSVSHKSGSEAMELLRERIGERAYLFLEPEDLAKLEQRLTTDGIARQMKQNRAVLDQSLDAFKKAVVPDPLGLAEIFESRLSRHGREFKSNDPAGYYLSPDKKLYVVRATPSGKCQDLEFSQKIIAITDNILATAWRNYESTNPQGAASLAGHYQTHLTGGYAAAVSANSILRRDLRVTFIISVVCVLLIFVISFRRIATAPLAAVPLLLAVVWTLAVAGLWFERISMISGCFAAILLGLGVDFAVHVYNRYVMERRKGATPEDSVHIAIVRTGGGIFLGGFTTAIAFFGITVTSFQGLSEIGFLAGWGIIFSMIAMTVILPSLLLVRARLGYGEDLQHFRDLTGFGLPRLSGLITSRPWPVLITSLALCAAGTVYLSTCMSTDFFNSDFRALGSKKDPAMRTANLLMERFEMSLTSISVVATAPTEAEALEISSAFAERARTVTGPGKQLGSYRSVLAFLPAPSNQKKAAALMGSVDYDRVEADIRKYAAENGMNPRAFKTFWGWLEKVETMASGDGPDLITSEDLAETSAAVLLDYFVARDEAGWHVQTIIVPSRGMHLRKWYDRLRVDLKVGDPGDSLAMTAPVLVGYELRDMVYGDFSKITLFVLGGVILSLVLLFRSILKSIVALLPMLMGIVFTLSALMLSGRRLNYINVIVLPMIIGVGIDYGIHMMHRFVHGSSIEEVIIETGRAVVVTTLTTVAGFGALCAAEYRGLASLGLVASLGVIMCMVTSVVVLPAALVALFPNWRGETEPDSGCGETEDDNDDDDD